MSAHPPDLVSAAIETLAAASTAGYRACLIGGMVVPRWGEPRATTDVDVSVLAPFGEEAEVIALLLRRFTPRIDAAERFAIDNRVLLLRTAAGVALDIALAAFPFELEAIDLATDWEALPGTSIRTCSAEHLILYKLVAARARDVSDVQGIVRRHGPRLDVDRIRRWGREFAELKEDPDLLRPFEDALRQSER
jgi:hypothetical protein